MSTIFFVLLCALLGSAAAQSEGSPCKKEGQTIPSTAKCKQYLECVKGKYEKKTCGLVDSFDAVKNECRWQPLATCVNDLHKKHEANKKQSDQKKKQESKGSTPTETGGKSGLTCMSDVSYCTQTVSVLEDCQYFCFCQPNKKLSEPISCLFDRYYDPVNNVCTDDSSVCPDYSPIKPGSKCVKNGERKPDHTDCKSYMECSGAKWTKKSCSFGQYYNPKVSECNLNPFYKYCKT